MNRGRTVTLLVGIALMSFVLTIAVAITSAVAAPALNHNVALTTDASGVVVNYTVNGRRPQAGAPGFHSRFHETGDVVRLHVRPAVGAWFAIEYRFVPRGGTLASEGVSATHAFGWPFPALTLSDDNAGGLGSGAASGSVILRQTNGRLPRRPYWPGFVMNFAVYLVILALPLAFFPIRRRLRGGRARRGRCPKCGYDLAGLDIADPAAPCPECGATR